jgi:hypothetical protein
MVVSSTDRRDVAPASSCISSRQETWVWHMESGNGGIILHLLGLSYTGALLPGQGECMCYYWLALAIRVLCAASR